MNKEFLFTPEELSKCEDRIINAFGLAMRAGKCIVGSEMCIEQIRAEKAKLVVGAGDLSENAIKKLNDACSYHNVELLFVSQDKAELGKRLGKKSGIACAAILDDGFVNICRKILGEVHGLMEVQQ